MTLFTFNQPKLYPNHNSNLPCTTGQRKDIHEDKERPERHADPCVEVVRLLVVEGHTAGVYRCEQTRDDAGHSQGGTGHPSEPQHTQKGKNV